jgi:hypothetical protein
MYRVLSDTLCMFQLWMMKGQIEEQEQELDAAKEAYSQGVNNYAVMIQAKPSLSIC